MTSLTNKPQKTWTTTILLNFHYCQINLPDSLYLYNKAILLANSPDKTKSFLCLLTNYYLFIVEHSVFKSIKKSEHNNEILWMKFISLLNLRAWKLFSIAIHWSVFQRCKQIPSISLLLFFRSHLLILQWKLIILFKFHFPFTPLVGNFLLKNCSFNYNADERLQKQFVIVV